MTTFALTTQGSLTIVAICQLITVVAVAVLTIGLLYAVYALKRMVSKKIDEAMAEVKPIAEEARSVAEQARRTADTISEKVDAIMTTAEDSAATVGNTVQSVSKRMEEAVNPQIVNVAALANTALKLIEVWKQAASIRSGPKPAEESSSGED